MVSSWSSDGFCRLNFGEEKFIPSVLESCSDSYYQKENLISFTKFDANIFM